MISPSVAHRQRSFPPRKSTPEHWRNSTSDTVNLGGTFTIGPQPNVATGWSWTGPNGYTATTREITLPNVTASQAGTYTATYTNSSGCKSTQKFMLAVNTTASLLTLHAKGSIGTKQIQLLKGNNPNVQLFDGRSELRIFNLKGVSVYNHRLWANELSIPNLKSGVYVVEVLRGNALLERKTFLID